MFRPVSDHGRYDLVFDVGSREIDAVAVYCEQLDRCYLLPMSLVEHRRGICARLPVRERPARCYYLGQSV